MTLLLVFACAPAALPADSGPAEATDSATPVDLDQDDDGVADVEDCAPADPAVFPGAVERADGVDNDCDGRVDTPVDLGTATATLRGGADGDALGNAVLLLGDTVWVGVPGADVAAGDEGRVLAFPRPLTGDHAWDERAAEVQGDAAGGELGATLAPVDLDTDGDAELFVGAPGAADAFVFDPAFSGSAGVHAALLIVHGGRLRDRFGAALAAGDVDGDGRTDLAIGAPAADGGDGGTDPAAGDVYVVLDAAATRDSDLDPTTTGPFRDAGAGTALVAVDLDGDGQDVLAIGAPIVDYPGRVYLVNGTPSPRLGDAPIAFEGAAAGDRTGTSLAAGDVDGDGHADLVVGAPGAGTVALLYGTPGGEDRADMEADAVLADADGGSEGLGISVTVPDLDGDGHPEIAAGATGEVCAWHGPFVGRMDPPSVRLVGGAGPLPVQGTGDLLVGDPTGAGVVWLFPGW